MRRWSFECRELTHGFERQSTVIYIEVHFLRLVEHRDDERFPLEVLARCGYVAAGLDGESVARIERYGEIVAATPSVGAALRGSPGRIGTRRRILYVQFTNPAAYPPLEHSARFLECGWT